MIKKLSLAVACGLAPLMLAAQETGVEPTDTAAAELTLPPTIASAPGETHLEPATGERDDVLEAVVTGGQTDWRLPDLGSSLRKQREEEAAESNERIEVGFIGLYDPEEDDAGQDFLSPDAEVMRGVGLLKLIELRFGRRPSD